MLAAALVEFIREQQRLVQAAQVEVETEGLKAQ
jgi:hypothetical protein